MKGDFLMSNNSLKQNLIRMVGTPQQKLSMFSITRRVPLSIKCSLTTTSHAVHKSTNCLLRHDFPVFLKGSPRVIEILECRVSSFFAAAHMIPKVVKRDSSLAVSFEVHSLQHPFPGDVTLMSWRIVIHEDQIRPELFTGLIL